MIVPILNGLLSFRKAPVTWILVALNVLVMICFSFSSSYNSNAYSKLSEDKKFLVIQGGLYQSYLKSQISHRLKRGLASNLEKSDQKNLVILGQLAFRDQGFLESDLKDSQFSDKVAYAYWKTKMNSFLKRQSQSMGHLLGISSYDHSLSSWASYMFAHGSWAHLVSNMVFLLIVGASLELSLGGFGLLMVYLFSGFIAAGIFILFSGLSASPLVGASGAVSGLITLFAVLNWRRPARYFYFLFIPERRTIGWVFLPGAFIFYMWVVTDLAGYLSQSHLMGTGVAHTAHLGGHLTGLIVGLVLLFISKRKSPEGEELPEMYKLHPLLKASS